MNEKNRLRQFYLRILLAVGILWGTQLFITLPFIFHGRDDTVIAYLAAVLNSLTIMPATVLAFWHRRTAAIWLTVNALLLLAAVLLPGTSTLPATAAEFIGISVPILLACLLDYIETKAWPQALNGNRNSMA